jgi:hypothetical protein
MWGGSLLVPNRLGGGGESAGASPGSWSSPCLASLGHKGGCRHETAVLFLLRDPQSGDPSYPTHPAVTRGQAQIATAALFPDALFPDALFPDALFPDVLFPELADRRRFQSPLGAPMLASLSPRWRAWSR